MSGVVQAWVDDGLVDVSEAAVPVDDRGLTTGDGCFETLKVIGGVPFALTRHLARLGRSCDILGLPLPSEDRVRQACAALIEANIAATGPDAVGRLRITVTAGRAPLGPNRAASPPGLFLLTGPPRVLGPVSVVAVSPWVRNERSPVAGAKVISYAENVVAQRWAADRGCDEALFANTRGELSEGTGSNVFVVIGGILRTPPLESGCLAGVTRELVCELADVRQTPIPMRQLGEATEMFLTSSTRDIHPVAAIDDRSLPAPGPAAARLRVLWRAMESRTMDP